MFDSDFYTKKLYFKEKITIPLLTDSTAVAKNDVLISRAAIVHVGEGRL